MRFTLLAIAALAGMVLSLPVQAKDDAHCASAKALVGAMAAKRPVEVDAVTQTTAVGVACDKKRVLLTRLVALKQSRMEADFKDYLQSQDNAFVCDDKGRRALMDAGWTWVTDYTFQDGAPVKIAAQCK